MTSDWLCNPSAGARYCLCFFLFLFSIPPRARLTDSFSRKKKEERRKRMKERNKEKKRMAEGKRRLQAGTEMSCYFLSHLNTPLMQPQWQRSTCLPRPEQLVHVTTFVTDRITFWVPRPKHDVQRSEEYGLPIASRVPRPEHDEQLSV